MQRIEIILLMIYVYCPYKQIQMKVAEISVKLQSTESFFRSYSSYKRQELPRIYLIPELEWYDYKASIFVPTLNHVNSVHAFSEIYFDYSPICH
jgi:hypothetical protein